MSYSFFIYGFEKLQGRYVKISHFNKKRGLFDLFLFNVHSLIIKETMGSFKKVTVNLKIYSSRRKAFI